MTQPFGSRNNGMFGSGVRCPAAKPVSIAVRRGQGRTRRPPAWAVLGSLGEGVNGSSFFDFFSLPENRGLALALVSGSVPGAKRVR